MAEAAPAAGTRALAFGAGGSFSGLCRTGAACGRPALGAGTRVRGRDLGVLRNNPAAVGVMFEIRNLAYRNNSWALRFEQYRQRDAEKVVKGILDYARLKRRSAQR